MSKTSPSLPSPPLSPHQFTPSDHSGRSNSVPVLPLPTTSVIPSSSTVDLLSHNIETLSRQLHNPLGSFGPLDKPSSPSSLPSSDITTETSFSAGSPLIQEDDKDVPMLPSQLRRRHESMRILAKQQQQSPIKSEPTNDDKCQETKSHDQTIPIIELNSQDTQDTQDIDELETINASYHSGAMVRAKSYSMFETTNDASHPWGSDPQMEYMNRLSTSCHHEEMPTKDWVVMQSRMQALELEISHVRRTNMLLNQELDKVNSHLSRITTNGDADEDGQSSGWRREYEFLVQQVDWMHQQLQLARAEKQGRSQYQAEMSQELRTEVKGLTDSLRMWQSAFQEAEEKYRRKCDGEQILKQTLRERETQLSSLVEKLTSYESEFQKSISNYEELMRLTAELELVEGEDKKPGVPKQLALCDSIVRNGLSDMPGTFPGQQWQYESKSDPALIEGISATKDQLTVSVLSWATLLATYMLS
ncbi:hypothetical protein BGZ46_000207 [Entomortierella lignicola]|nr:hypothetical protein BGZ46_000207 [Entomortierella lignicola]